MSYTLDAILDQAIDNYPVTATLSPEIVAVLFFALSQIENPEVWLDYTQDQSDQISDTDRDEIEALVSRANMDIISPEVGFIKAYITTTPPTNTIPCDGGTYNREDYPLLYAVLDSVFIIDVDTFSTPDMRGRTMVGVGSGAGGVYALGDSAGEKNHQLSESELASHAHSIELTTSVLGVAPGEVAFDVTVPLLSDYTGSTGGDTPHNNMQPYVAVKYCVQAR